MGPEARYSAVRLGVRAAALWLAVGLLAALSPPAEARRLAHHSRPHHAPHRVFPIEIAGGQYTPATWTDLTGWHDDDHLAAFATFRKSCKAILVARQPLQVSKAMGDSVPEPIGPNDTVYLTTADAEGNYCSFISSVAGGFGAAITCARTGVLFQNRGTGFSMKAGHPNALAPRKRSLHTIIPGFVTKAGAPFLSYGVMQGNYQPIGQVQLLQNIVDFGMDVQQAIDAERGMRTPRGFEAERSIPAATLTGLSARGHPVLTAGLPWGGGQAIMPVNGVLHAGSDPRKDGLALAR